MAQGLLYLGTDEALLHQLRDRLTVDNPVVHCETLQALRRQTRHTVGGAVFVHLSRMTLGVFSPARFIGELIAAADRTPIIALADQDCPHRLQQLAGETAHVCLPRPFDFGQLNAALFAAAKMPQESGGVPPAPSSAGSSADGSPADDSQIDGSPAEEAAPVGGPSLTDTAYGSASISSSFLMRVRNGDDEAWARLMKLYTPLVYRWCRQCSLQQHEAEDVAQEVFRSVSTAVVSFRRDRSGASFRGWMWTITRNKIRDYARVRAARPPAIGGSTIQRRFNEVSELELDESTARASDSDEHRMLHTVMDLIKDEFEPHTWTAFWRLTVDGHTAAEIASDLDMKKPAVRQAKYRVLRRLRQQLNEVM